MSTTWRPAPLYSVGEWMLQDGTIVATPQVEATLHGKRVRVRGTDASVPKSDVRSEIKRVLDAKADGMGERVWMEMSQSLEQEYYQHKIAAIGSYGQLPEWDEPPPKVEITERRKTPVMFEFVHPELPIRALLWVVMDTNRYGYAEVLSTLTYRSTDPAESNHHQCKSFNTADGWDARSRMQWAAPVSWPMERENFGTNVRGGLGRFMELVKWAEQIEWVEIPDERNPWEHKTLRLKYARTNLTNEFWDDCLEMIQAGPAMERLHEHLLGVQRELSQLGVVAELKKGFDLPGLLNGRLSELQVVLPAMQVEDTTGGTHHRDDKAHKVTIDLMRGVVMVSCANDVEHLDDIAAAWEVAKFKAELTGEEDVLLQFALAHQRPAEQARLQKLIDERKVHGSRLKRGAT